MLVAYHGKSTCFVLECNEFDKTSSFKGTDLLLCYDPFPCTVVNVSTSLPQRVLV